MEYALAESYLLATINETVSRRMPYRLERMRAFLHELGNPQDAYPTIHIGGTSGKGSTSTIVAAALQAAGKRVGLHTKPHLRSMTERVRVNGLPISQERFAQFLETMMPAIERTMESHGRPTYYETLLALAFLAFAQESVEVAVIEVGLGGRLDGTNVIVPRVAAITTVGYDHQDVLGETLEEIAMEKAGIAKPNVPLVVGVEDADARRVILEHAAAVGAPAIELRNAATLDEMRMLRDAQAFAVRTPRGRYDIVTTMLGEFQRHNAAMAIAILEQLDDGLRPSISAVQSALGPLVIPGRMEVYRGYPTVVFDIAHNAEKADHLVRSLRETFGDRRFSFVVAVSESKDATEIVRALASVSASFTFTTFETAGRHAIKPARLASIAESVGAWGRAVSDPVEALAIARRNGAADDVVVVTGSTFIVAQLREWWLVAA
ncbi:MAG TPA: folylpolyglutamate synthase/dihydrofolate synthase family protein [Candidatus Baltobacteraceae bacterium]|nr:folylpolyglutamate synthase/dihydrofolate synthase family protein [Candidatus Baltobacteraceae bacterium]